jgi:hypothetical protein
MGIYIHIYIYIQLYTYAQHISNLKVFALPKKRHQNPHPRPPRPVHISEPVQVLGHKPLLGVGNLELDEGNFAGDSVVDVEKG